MNELVILLSLDVDDDGRGKELAEAILEQLKAQLIIARRLPLDEPIGTYLKSVLRLLNHG